MKAAQHLRIYNGAITRMIERKSLVLEREFVASAIREEGLTEEEATSRARDLLRDSADVLDPDEVEALLVLAGDLMKAEGGVSILNHLLLLRNHMKHEDIARKLQRAADASSVPCLLAAIDLELDYLSWDGNKALARKCFWALAAIGTPDAWQAITTHSQSKDPIIAQWAAEQIERRGTPENPQSPSPASSPPASMPPEYRLTGKLTFDEYHECHRILAARRRLILRAITLLIGTMFFINGAMQDPADPIGIGIGIAAFLYVLVLSPLQFRYRVKRLWQRNPSLHKGMDITILQDGLRITDDKGQPFHKDWDGFLKFRESTSLFLLYLSPLSPFCLPKRLIPQEDHAAVRKVISAALPNPDASGEDEPLA